MHCWIIRTKAHVCTCSFVHILLYMCTWLCAWFIRMGQLKSQWGRPKLSQNQSQNKVKSLGRLTHMHVSPCAVTFVDCCIFLFFGVCVRSYLHKRGFNGWQLFVFVCYCFSKSRCYKCSYLHKRGFNGWQLFVFVCYCFSKSRCYKCSYLHKRGFNGWQLFVFVCYCFSKSRCYKCSYLHKRGFNGWHLVCLCWFHFPFWKSRCYKLKVVFSFFPLPLCKIYKC